MIRLLFSFYPLYVFLEVISASARGANHPIAAFIIVVANMFALRTLALLITVKLFTNWLGIAVVFPISWVAVSICLFAYLFITKFLDRPMIIQKGEE